MIGLDIGSKNIKICEITGNEDGKYHVNTALMTDSPVNDGSSDKALTKKIKSIIKKQNFSTKITASSVGGAQITIREFNLPKLNDEELKSAVRYEAEQLILSDIDTMDMDYQIVPPLDGDRHNILFAAADRKNVNRTANIILDAGLELKIMDVANLSLANCLKMRKYALDMRIMLPKTLILSLAVRWKSCVPAKEMLFPLINASPRMNII